MENAQIIGRIASPTDQVVVERAGEQITLQQGEALLQGDIIQNQDKIAIDIELPARAGGQADSLVTLAPDSAAQLDLALAADGVSQQIEVTALTDGVELYALGEGADGAILMASAGGEFSGLVGAGVLAGGSVSTAAAAVGGGVGLAALAGSGSDSSNATTSSEAEFTVGSGMESSTEDTEASDMSTGGDNDTNSGEDPNAGDDTGGEDEAESPLPEPIAEQTPEPILDAIGALPLDMLSGVGLPSAGDDSLLSLDTITSAITNAPVDGVDPTAMLMPPSLP